MMENYRQEPLRIMSGWGRRILTMTSFVVLVGWLSWVSGGTGKPSVEGWQPGKGWGWIWGKQDEVGALNGLTDQTRAAALKLAVQGKVYDLGITYSRNSYKWPGHSPGEIMMFRSPEGVKRQLDNDFIEPKVNPLGMAWHSCALFINDNVATQIDGLGHVVVGQDNHWYNGFTEDQWGGDFGIRKCDATTIPSSLFPCEVGKVAHEPQPPLMHGIIQILK